MEGLVVTKDEETNEIVFIPWEWTEMFFSSGFANKWET